MNATIKKELETEPFAREALARLAVNAPQVLLLEGASEPGRLAFALYWAMSANCPRALAKARAGEAAEPCGDCPVCAQIAANEFTDLHIYDGRIGNKRDEDKPGPIRALSVDNARDLKRISGTAPRGAGKRVAIIQGMSQTREEALNCLLKTLEEPSETTLYVLLTPQRNQILPTLVSRSLCFTLPWRDSSSSDADLADWEAKIVAFMRGGDGLLEQVAAKGALDATLAGRLVLLCQKALARSLGNEGDEKGAFATIAAAPARAALAMTWMNEAQTMLAANASPARVLEGLFSGLFVLAR